MHTHSSTGKDSVEADSSTIQRAADLKPHPFTEDAQEKLPKNEGGFSLPKGVREKFEVAFQADFGDVRVHETPEAKSIGAVAYTQGNHIHFDSGQYDPHTESGQSLLGHELTHVVQQRAGRVAAPSGNDVPINADPTLEAEADVLGARAAQGIAVNGNAVSTQSMQLKVSQTNAPVQRQGYGYEDEERMMSVWADEPAGMSSAEAPMSVPASMNTPVPTSGPSLSEISGEFRAGSGIEGQASDLKEEGFIPEWLHTGLDIAGLIPGFGEVADGVNALLYAAQGRSAEAAISAAAMIPGLGAGATGSKLAAKAGKEIVEAGAETAAKQAGKQAAESGVKKGAQGASKSSGKSASKVTNTNRKGGGKTGRKLNPDRAESWRKKAQELEEKLKKAKTKKEKKEIKRQLAHARRKATQKSENHAQKGQ